MHNKLFIADNSFAVSGGRNIANEYFMRSSDANFIDLDVLSSGTVVRELSGVFDTYWNSNHVYPVASLWAQPLTPEAARRRFDELVHDAAPAIDERPRDALGLTPVAQQLDSGALDQIFAAAQVFADTPDKVAGVAQGSASAAMTVTERTLGLFAAARSSGEIASPYFIPGQRGLAMMRAATAEGGRAWR